MVKEKMKAGREIKHFLEDSSNVNFIVQKSNMMLGVKDNGKSKTIAVEIMRHVCWFQGTVFHVHMREKLTVCMNYVCKGRASWRFSSHT